MDKPEVIKIVKREVPRYQKLLNLPHWIFNFQYGWIDDAEDSFYGKCWPDPDYNTATIKINFELHENEEILVRTIRHEMLHVVHAEFETYRKAASLLMTKPEFMAMDVVFGACCEKTVKQLEFMLKSLGIPLVKPKPKKKEKKVKKKK